MKTIPLSPPEFRGSFSLGCGGILFLVGLGWAWRASTLQPATRSGPIILALALLLFGSKFLWKAARAAAEYRQQRATWPEIVSISLTAVPNLEDFARGFKAELDDEGAPVLYLGTVETTLQELFDRALPRLPQCSRETVVRQARQLRATWACALVEGSLDEARAVLSDWLKHFAASNEFRHFSLEFRGVDTAVQILANFPKHSVPIRIWKCGSAIMIYDTTHED